MSLTVAPDTIEFFPQAAIGQVEQPITLHQRGRVKFMATTWFARFYQPTAQTQALPGTRVKVIGREGLTLLVVAVGNDQHQLEMSATRPETAQLSLLQRMNAWFAA
ncbi:MAG: NfeD family protein [Lyngbya sp. HA4199-MV5]|jgi:CDP-diacylglycerol pyrophosphatase|nr:NfeD family protein [Lyngbya sp. HA4199-MV5]